MKIVGIDPGVATTGYGVVEVNGSEKFKVIDFGLIETGKDGKIEDRLQSIHLQMNSLLEKFTPDVFVMEKIFFATNAKTAISVGQAQGVMLLAAAKAKIKVFEYAPGTVKKVVAGDGRADKSMIKKSVRKILGAKVRSKAKQKTHFDNATDALALAVCHIWQFKRG